MACHDGRTRPWVQGDFALRPVLVIELGVTSNRDHLAQKNFRGFDIAQ
jgi:hypothetical protein